MAFDNDIHHRGSIRLKSYDYAQSGVYYLTLCSYQKQHIFGSIADGQMTANRLGLIVQTCWMSIPEHNLGVHLDEYVIMPDHLHGIIVVSEVDAAAKEGQVGYRQAKAWQAIPSGSRQFASPRQGSIGAIVRTFKAAVTREVRHMLNDNSIVLWQRNYYEHIIRGESEMSAARDYIRNNPANWSSNREHAK